jgi:hypothetical protein
MSEVLNSLQGIRVEGYVFGFLFFASYSFTLTEFIGTRGRRWAVLAAVANAAGFAATAPAWEHGVLLVAFAVVAMGGFMALSWGAWALLERHADTSAREPATVPRAPLAARRQGRAWPAWLPWRGRSST